MGRDAMSLAVLLIAVSASGELPRNPDDLLLHAIPSSVHHRTEIPANENGFADWQRAATTYDAALEQEPELSNTVKEVATNSAPFPGGDKGASLSDWLARQEAVLALVDKVAARDRLQLPPLPLEPEGAEWKFSPWRSLGNLKALRAKQFVSQGNWGAGARDIWDMVHVGSLLAAGDAELIRYLVANAVQLSGLRRIQWLARTRHVPEEVLEDLAARLATPPDFCAVWGTSLRVEFTQFWVPTRRDDDLDSVLKELMPESQSKRAQFVHQLLAQHPDPFDIFDTVYLLSERIQRDCDACASTWPEVKRRTGNVEQLSAAEQMLEGLIVGGKAMPEPRAVDRAAKDLRMVPNPVGRLLVRQRAISGYVSTAFTQQAEWRATRLIVLLEIHRQRHSTFPRALSELPVSGDTRALEDPFSSRPFHYSAARQLLWSVGEDSKNDNGRTCRGIEKCTKGADLVWEISTDSTARSKYDGASSQ